MKTRAGITLTTTVALLLCAVTADAKSCGLQMHRMLSAQTLRLIRCSINHTLHDGGRLEECRARVVDHGIKKLRLRCANPEEIVAAAYADTDNAMAAILPVVASVTGTCEAATIRMLYQRWRAEVQGRTIREQHYERTASHACGQTGTWRTMVDVIRATAIDPYGYGHQEQ